MAALMIKVGSLVIKQIAKPVASRFQSWALNHPTARRYIITGAQYMHRAEIFITRMAEGKKGKAFVGQMSEEHSIELASKLASEGFVLAVGISIVLFEYERSRRVEMKKKAVADEEKRALLERNRYEQERLSKENQEQQEKIQWLMSRVDSVERTLNDFHAKQAAKARSWGGFFGPRGLGQAES